MSMRSCAASYTLSAVNVSSTPDWSGSGLRSLVSQAVPFERRSEKAAVPFELLGQLRDRVEVQGCVKIGSGREGDVILARDTRSDMQFAVKIISLPRVQQKFGGDVSKVRREAQAMRDLSEFRHPNLVRFVDFLACAGRLPGIEQEPPYACIIMEHVHNSEPLSDVIKRDGPQPALARKIVPQLASALALMHQQGIVHRDVWPENVMVNKYDQQAVIVDLGCAEYYRTGANSCNSLNMRRMSPQSVQKQRQDPADDCWALGLLITELVTGRRLEDRLNGSRQPACCAAPHAIEESIGEASMQGGPLLGSLARQLLEFDASKRPSMQDVCAQIASGASVATSAGSASVCLSGASSSSPTGSLRDFPLAPRQGATAAATGASISSMSGTPPLAAGQKVMYTPRSHNIPHAAVVVGRVPGRQAWQIQLQLGAFKEVEDAEVWRLSPMALASNAQAEVVNLAAVRPLALPPTLQIGRTMLPTGGSIRGDCFMRVSSPKALHRSPSVSARHIGIPQWPLAM